MHYNSILKFNIFPVYRSVAIFGNKRYSPTIFYHETEYFHTDCAHCKVLVSLTTDCLPELRSDITHHYWRTHFLIFFFQFFNCPQKRICYNLANFAKVGVRKNVPLR